MDSQPNSAEIAVSPSPMPRWRRWLPAALAAVAGVVVAVLFLMLRPQAVVVEEAREGEAIELVYASGVVEYVRQAQLAPAVSAPIRSVRASEGELVRAGQLLAELASGAEEATALQLAVLAAQASEVARRNQRLFTSGYVSRATRDDSRRQAQAAEAAALAARERLRDYRIVAPFAGRIIRRDAEPGDLAAPGNVLFVVADPSKLRITADIDERDAARIREAMSAYVRADAFGDQRFEATVSSLTPQGDSAARVFRARLALPADTALRPGMTVETNIIVARRAAAILVPADAVQDAAVWVLEGDSVRRRPVKIGVVDADKVEVRRGLSARERVVRAPVNLKDGQKVRARVAVKP